MADTKIVYTVTLQITTDRRIVFLMSDNATLDELSITLKRVLDACNARFPQEKT